MKIEKKHQVTKIFLIWITFVMKTSLWWGENVTDEARKTSHFWSENVTLNVNSLGNFFCLRFSITNASIWFHWFKQTIKIIIIRNSTYNKNWFFNTIMIINLIFNSKKVRFSYFQSEKMRTITSFYTFVSQLTELSGLE